MTRYRLTSKSILTSRNLFLISKCTQSTRNVCFIHYASIMVLDPPPQICKFHGQKAPPTLWGCPDSLTKPSYSLQSKVCFKTLCHGFNPMLSTKLDILPTRSGNLLPFSLSFGCVWAIPDNDQVLHPVWSRASIHYYSYSSNVGS